MILRAGTNWVATMGPKRQFLFIPFKGMRGDPFKKGIERKRNHLVEEKFRVQSFIFIDFRTFSTMGKIQSRNYDIVIEPEWDTKTTGENWLLRQKNVIHSTFSWRLPGGCSYSNWWTCDVNVRGMRCHSNLAPAPHFQSKAEYLKKTLVTY